MSDILAIAETAMRNSMATLDRVGHNVANANTPAYKRELRVEEQFGAHLSEQVAATEPHRDFSAGPLQFTGAPMSFAIEGDGWFQLQSPHGVVLTRNGAFRLDGEGRLSSTHGWPVLLDADARIPPGNLTLRAGNELWIDDIRVGRFLIADAKGHVLQSAGPGVYRSVAGAVPESSLASVRQGYIEGANVNSLTEMVSLIEAMRHAEAAQRMMRAYDEALAGALTTLGEF